MADSLLPGAIRIVRIGSLDGELAANLTASLASRFEGGANLDPAALDPRFAFHHERRQCHSTEILARLSSLTAREGLTPDGRILGVASADIYIPILTFVFGEAQIEGRCAVISAFRLREEFYGLPADPELLRERLLKEALHEIGHTFGLTHCRSHVCVMSASHSVDRIDLKGMSFCAECSGRFIG